MHHVRQALLVLTLTPAIGLTAQLSLENYLIQVQTQNQGVVAGQLIVMALEERKDEADLIFKPSLFVQGQISVDKRPVGNVSTQGDQTNNEFLSAGVLQQFNFGLKGQLSYNLSHTKIYNASTTFVPSADFNEGFARLELSQSLWRNLNGKESRAQEILIDSQSKASKHSEKFKIKLILANAESVYWSMSQMKKLVKVQSDNLIRAHKLTQWNQRRSNSGLGDRSDFLQAEANLKLREFELKRTQQDQVSLQRVFNSLRGVDNAEVSESSGFSEFLEVVDVKKILSLPSPLKTEQRDDVKAAYELQNLAKANAALAIERNKPTFELYGAYAFNGRDKTKLAAIGNSFTNDHPTSAVGIRFNAPLDFGTTKSVISSYKKDQIAADYNYQRRVFEQENEWKDLLTKFEDAKERLTLVQQIAEAQKNKSLYENNRLNNGRTTTFQVLNFEQDYASSELLRIQTETDLLTIYSKLKIYNPGAVQ